MRLYLTITRNTSRIPFNYQPFLTGAMHKWLGENNREHDEISLYSFSWLQNVNASKTGINLTRDSYFFISVYDADLARRLVNGITEKPAACFGSIVSEIQIVETPTFPSAQTFFTASPVFIKRRLNNEDKHITYENPSSAQYLTETLQKKLKVAGLQAEGVEVKFDSSYLNPATKFIRYNEVSNRVSVCPVVVAGSPDQVAFAWDVGIGNSTGIGFGALK